jgi:hypothetical protein
VKVCFILIAIPSDGSCWSCATLRCAQLRLDKGLSGTVLSVSTLFTLRRGCLEWQCNATLSLTYTYRGADWRDSAFTSASRGLNAFPRLFFHRQEAVTKDSRTKLGISPRRDRLLVTCYRRSAQITIPQLDGCLTPRRLDHTHLHTLSLSTITRVQYGYP